MSPHSKSDSPVISPHQAHQPLRISTFRGAPISYIVRMFRTQDLHVKEIVRLLTPRELKALFAGNRCGQRHRGAQPRTDRPHFAAGRPAPARRHRAVLNS